MSTAPRPDDAQRELIQRVAGSTAFQKTWRLRELFLYLCDRVRRDPDRPPREQEIGRDVFGRGDDFDPGLDPLVRVQTSQLRKRLQLYFSSEGAGEPLVIDIPKGAYVPVVRPREAAASPRPPRLILALAAVALLLIVGGVVAFRTYRSAHGPAAHRQPTVETLWRAVARPGRITYVILADGSLSVFLDETHRVLSAADYQRRGYAAQYRPPKARPVPVDDPPQVGFARELMTRPLTSVVDADVALRSGAWIATLGGRPQLLFARDATPDRFKSHDLVISGTQRDNPWLELFEPALNFRSRVRLSSNTVYFQNLAPQPGEAAEYDPSDPTIAYCRVALLPNLDKTGSVLAVTGSDAAATGAGLELITDEARLADLARTLGVAADAPFPSFELLLKLERVLDARLKLERVAHRTYPVAAGP